MSVPVKRLCVRLTYDTHKTSLTRLRRDHTNLALVVIYPTIGLQRLGSKFVRCSQNSDEDSRTKIAILDTGIDLDHVDMQAQEERIKSVRSWVGGRNGREDREGGNVYGNGTHVAGLLLDIAPQADIFVARIAEGGELKPTDHIADNIADVSSPYTATLRKSHLSRLSEWRLRHGRLTLSLCHLDFPTGYQASNLQFEMPIMRTSSSSPLLGTMTAIVQEHIPQNKAKSYAYNILMEMGKPRITTQEQ